MDNRIIQAERHNYLWLWIGANTTGKTPTAIKRALAYKKSRPDQKIACFDPRKSIRKIKIKNSRTGQEESLVDHVIEEWHTDWAENLLGTDKNGNKIKKPWKDYLLILDDYHMLCKHYKTPQGLRNLLALRVEYNIDVIGITHTPKNILEGIVDYVTDYSIFYNLAKSASFEDKIANYEKCQAGAIVVNEYVNKFGMGKYPVFPYVHVNNKTGKMSYVNMPSENLEKLKCFKKFVAC